jgi:4a-hydroxytetrahydrobiopterin dehydratase
MRPVLSSSELADLPKILPLWIIAADGQAISRDFKFTDFKQAFAFMTEVAAQADRVDHHPEWSNVYNCVSVRLTTHDSGGVTQSDVHLAGFMDTCASRYHI